MATDADKAAVIMQLLELTQIFESLEPPPGGRWFPRARRSYIDIEQWLESAEVRIDQELWNAAAYCLVSARRGIQGLKADDGS